MNTGVMCAVLLDTKGPEIRTGFLKKTGRKVKLEKGKEIMVTTDYEHIGDSSMIAMSYKSLPKDVAPGGTILCADGSITLTVLECATLTRGEYRLLISFSAVRAPYFRVLPGDSFSRPFSS